MLHIEFDDESASATGKKHDALSYEVSEEAHLRLEVLDGVPFLFGNRPGFLSLARILIKMGLSTVSTFICAGISVETPSCQIR